MTKGKDITYCGKCKRYFEGHTNDNSNCPCCPNCGDWHKIIRIAYESDGSFYIEELDEMMLNFWSVGDCKRKLKVMDNLLQKSQNRSFSKLRNPLDS